MVSHGVILTGNAKADNVFWNVGSSATIGVKSFMIGNFLTATSITVQTGATMDGRFLTQTGAVTFDSNTINTPPPILHF
jgi:Ice-binding-like